ncbi:MAG TPA: hypothetical protein VHJ78_11165 [Actinomycetota bacterium]|nr:hypothetical protein [Actinomycetota bacterium]
MNQQDLKKLAFTVGFLRLGIGTVAIVAPGIAMKLWLGADSKSKPVKAMGLSVGARDVAIGVGTIGALSSGRDPSLWLKLGAFADAADAVGTVRTFREDPGNPRMLTALMAGGFAGIGWLLSRQGELSETG